MVSSRFGERGKGSGTAPERTPGMAHRPAIAWANFGIPWKLGIITLTAPKQRDFWEQLLANLDLVKVESPAKRKALKLTKKERRFMDDPRQEVMCFGPGSYATGLPALSSRPSLRASHAGT